MGALPRGFHVQPDDDEAFERGFGLGLMVGCIVGALVMLFARVIPWWLS